MPQVTNTHTHKNQYIYNIYKDMIIYVERLETRTTAVHHKVLRGLLE